MTSAEGESEQLKLSAAASTLFDECRMVLPGVQAIFGFQLIAVFQQKFGEELDKPYQCLHLAALVLVALSATLIMTPAAYHRAQGSRHVSERFLHTSSRLLLFALAPLALGLSLDVFLLGKLVLGRDTIAAVLAAFVFGAMVFMWYVFPHAAHRATPN
jgi:hypothetical protein